MKRQSIIATIVLITLCVSHFTASALPTSRFASNSKLSTGRWAKIRVSETGVHQITAQQLADLGFKDISKVKVFGKGGYVLKETLNNNQPDDISQIAIYCTDDKVFFYAQGATEMVANATSSNPYYTGIVNPYSLYGYYFITDSDDYGTILLENSIDDVASATSSTSQSYDYVFHNNELISLLNSGKTFYGEDLTMPYNISFNLPNRVKGTPINVAFSVGASVSTTCTIDATVNDKNINLYSYSLSRLGSSKHFEICSPYGSAPDVPLADSYSFKVNINSSSISLARLDYVSATYTRENVLHADSAQMRMAFYKANKSEKVVISSKADHLIVWDVTNGKPRKQYNLSGKLLAFIPNSINSWEEYVAFCPEKDVKPVIIEGVIENQNLHALSTPDFVIIHPKNFKTQADRLANIHHTYDGYDVLTIDEELIFNEFSSGTPDATAYRLFLKMLYDRNPGKLKYLLLLGCGSYDNRGINGFKSENQLLTYQSSDSNGLVSSYTTDDYFGFLADRSGVNIPTDILTICVGRIPAKDEIDANAAINNLVDYISHQESEAWKSNMLIISDKGDKDLHTTQAEGLESIVRSITGENNFNIEKIYQEWYTSPEIITDNISNGAENMGRNRLHNLLNEGLLYVSYIGHAGPTVITHDNRLWTSERIRVTKYKHLPFFSIAACETAKFDDIKRSFCEELVLAENGGAIGVVAAARTVYSSQNDMLNKAIGRSLFTLKDDGTYRTIGEACKEGKKSFGTSSNYNKLSFTLFGDPAVRFRFPINRCKISHINGKTVNDKAQIALSTMSTITISGCVNALNGNLDTNFNGTATISLFDKARYYKNLVSPSTKDTFSCDYPREKLCHGTTNVRNGKFTISLTIPRHCYADGDTCVISVFAQSTDHQLASGSENRFVITQAKTTITDNKAPKFTEVLINGLKADDIVSVGSNPTIQFTATDNLGIVTQPSAIQGTMKLSIDGGKINIPAVSNYTQAFDNGTRVVGNVPLHDLTTGKHTLRIELSDHAGNSAVKEVVFYVVNNSLRCTLQSASESTRTPIELSLITDYHMLHCTYFITDISGNIIKSEQNGDYEFIWDLTDYEGNRVKPGKYTAYATFSGDDGQGTSPSIKIVVLEQ